MDATRLKTQLSENDIFSLLEHLGAEPYIERGQIICRTICHGGDSHKLYYYGDNHNFVCYTHCGTMDIFSLIEKVLNIEFTEACKYVQKYFNIVDNDSEMHYNDVIDQSFFNKFNKVIEYQPLKVFSTDYLNVYSRKYHLSWIKDGIYPSTMDKFNIRMSVLNKQIIIPHYDIDGNLVGIRARNLDHDLVSQGKKYMPVIQNGIMFNHPTGANLYGLYQNIDNIKQLKKIVLVESEKSVLQLDRMYNGYGIGVAVSGGNFSDRQLDLIQKLGVEEVIIAMDKEFHSIGDELERYYATKIRQTIANRILPYAHVSVIWDKNGLLDYKDSPTDKGVKVFRKLYKERIKL